MHRLPSAGPRRRRGLLCSVLQDKKHLSEREETICQQRFDLGQLNTKHLQFSNVKTLISLNTITTFACAYDYKSL